MEPLSLVNMNYLSSLVISKKKKRPLKNYLVRCKIMLEGSIKGSYFHQVLIRQQSLLAATGMATHPPSSKEDVMQYSYTGLD